MAREKLLTLPIVLAAASPGSQQPGRYLTFDRSNVGGGSPDPMVVACAPPTGTSRPSVQWMSLHVFPDGRHTMVESDRHGVNRKWKIDVYRLALDASNRADRITFFDASGGPYHGSNPVVSPDGRFAVVQLGIHGMGAGQGRGRDGRASSVPPGRSG